jgi:hypothetical protein
MKPGVKIERLLRSAISIALPHRNLSRISHSNQTTDEDVNRQTETEAGAVDTTLHRQFAIAHAQSCPKPQE